MRFICSFALTCLAVAATASLSGCASEVYAPEEAPEQVVIRDFASFYRFGPAQPRGADAALPVDTRVKLLRKEMGYSLVMLPDSRTGYVANEDLVPAPPGAPSAEVAETGSPTPSRSGRSSSRQRYSGPQVNDSPLPEPAPPAELDLDIGPEDVVVMPPAPEEPAESPRFRY
jgi:hypothetical protein